MNKCKLKKGDRIYECRFQQAILTELITNPEFVVQKDGDWLFITDETDTAQLFRDINPATYLPSIYSTYVGQEAEPSEEQKASLYYSMLKETIISKSPSTENDDYLDHTAKRVL